YVGEGLLLQRLQRVTSHWWRVRDSNPRPRRCERRALPTELTPRNCHAILPARPSGDKSPDVACHARAHGLGAALSPKAFRRGAKRSRGNGKNVVVFRSDATSRMVCRYRSCTAMGKRARTSAASLSLAAAWASPSALMTLARRPRSASACLDIVR